MKVLVAYASRHGATRGIAERVAERLARPGIDVTLEEAERVDRVADYDAFVVGGSAYITHWAQETTAFVRRHRDALASHPTWLFSSGPLGTAMVDAKGRDVLESSRPTEFPELADAVHARDEKIFFGAYDPNAKPIGLMERFMRVMPAPRDAVPIGDFRDWPAIEAWADGIGTELVGSRQALDAAG